MWRVLFLALISLSTFGCKKKSGDSLQEGETIVSLSLRRRHFPGAPSISLSQEILTSWLKGFSAKGRFRIRIGSPKGKYESPFHLEVEYTIRPVQVIRPVRRKGVLHDRAFEVSVHMALQPLFTSALEESLHGTESVWRSFSKNQVKNLDELFRDTLKGAVEKSAAALWFRASLKRAKPKDLVAYLSSQKRTVRMTAVDIIGQRRVVEAVPRLIEMLKTERREQYKMRIAGVLGQLGDEAAVEPLSEFALSLTDEHTVAVLAIIALIGGEKARTFLQWMASGHQSKAVRRGAKIQLDRLEEQK